MRLSEREQDRLLIFSAAELARRHRASGLKLSAPEAVALMCDAMFEAARADRPYAEVEAAGYGAVAPDEVMDGVAALVDEVRLEVLMRDGTRLVVLNHPLGDVDGTQLEQTTDSPLRPDRERKVLTVTNTGRHGIRVSSRFPFEQVNPRLSFDRTLATGFHLDIEPGSTVRWAPGETRDVTLIRARKP